MNAATQTLPEPTSSSAVTDGHDIRPCDVSPELRPNLALKAVRKALEMRQSQFAELIGSSLSLVTSIEVGRRKATPDFANTVAGKTGAMPEPIMRHEAEALDCYGRTYSIVSYRAFREARPDTLDDRDLAAVLRPLKIAIEAASDAGRLRIFTLLLKTAVRQLVQVIDGVQDAVDERLTKKAVVRRRYTYGELRKDDVLAAALGFKDSEDRGADEIAFEVNATDPESFREPWFNAWYGENEPLILEKPNDRGGGYRADFSAESRPEPLDKANETLTNPKRRLRGRSSMKKELK